MDVQKLKKDKREVTRVLGVDGSSTSMAFCLMTLEDGEWSPKIWGKMDVTGKDVFERCGDVNSKLYGLMKLLRPDHVAVESVIYVNNRSVVIQLAKIVGAMLGVVVATGQSASEVPPVTWMNYIGNPTRDSDEVKQELKKEFPGKTKSWYKNELRKRRKQRTMRWVRDTYGLDVDDDDVSDAFGICYYAVNNLEER